MLPYAYLVTHPYGNDEQMLVPTPYDIRIERGVSWPGFDVVCYNAAPPPAGTGTVVDITGWHPHAQIRATPEGLVVCDLVPFVPVGSDGVVRFPLITDEGTLALVEVNGVWNLVMETPTGDRQPPIAQGAGVIFTNITRNEP